MEIKKSIKWFIKGNSRKARHARQFTKFTIIIILFVALFWFVPIKDVLQALLEVNILFFLCGLFFSYLLLIVDSIKQKLLTNKMGVNLRVWQLFSISLTTKFYLLFTPATFVGSSLRWYKITEKGGGTYKALVVVALNRLIDIFLILVLGLFFGFFGGQENITLNIWLLICMVFIPVVLWITLMQLIQPLLDWVIHLETNSKPHYLRSIFQKSRKMLEALWVFRSFSIGQIVLIFMVGVFVNVLGLISYWYFAKSVGIKLMLFDLGWIRSLIILTSFLPISFAGGLGVRELSLVSLLSLFGINAEVALAFSFLLFSKGVLISLSGGIIEAGQTIKTGRLY